MAVGFGQGGPLDQLPPGPALAAFLAEASDGDAETGAGPTRASAAGSAVGPFAGLALCDDSTLIGLIRGWRKQASLAAAAEHAAAAELAARRHAEAKTAGEWDSTAANAADVEIAAALTLTPRAASDLIDRAATLRELPATFAALASGRIDMPKALVLITGLAGQDPALARQVEAQVIGRAPAQTTGQLRAALHCALIAADPDAAEKRREDEEQRARIERGPEPGGLTATLAGRNLPVTATVAAWNRITALARQLKTSGAPGPLDQLRVQVYLALLAGQATHTGPETNGTAATRPGGRDKDGDGDGGSSGATPGTRPPEPADETSASPADPAREGAPDPARPGASDPAPPESTGPASDAQAPAPGGTPEPGIVGSGAAGNRPPEPANEASADPSGTSPRIDCAAIAAPAPLTGTVNLTVPLATLLRLTASPGELGGFGPITAHTAREIAAGALGAPAVRWCITVTSENGEAVGHGCAARAAPATPLAGRRPGARAAPGTSGWTFTMKITALAGPDCGHQRESAHYRPPPSLWHLIQVRNPRCTAPGCRMPATRCDDDHTLAFDKGGRSCECNLGPLCRHHHRVKQSQGWRLEQPEPGIFAWVTPAGWQYITGPENYSA